MVEYPDKKLRQKRRKKRIPLSQEVKKSINSLIITLTAINIVLSVVFLLNASQTTQKGYILKQSQLKKEQLMMKKKALDAKLIESQKLNSLTSNDTIKEMEAATQETFYIPHEKTTFNYRKKLLQ